MEVQKKKAKSIKALPCSKCKVATLPDGKAYTIYSLGSDPRPFKYRCSKCGQRSQITAAQVAYLPPYNEKP